MDYFIIAFYKSNFGVKVINIAYYYYKKNFTICNKSVFINKKKVLPSIKQNLNYTYQFLKVNLILLYLIKFHKKKEIYEKWKKEKN